MLCLNADWTTAYSTAGLLLFTIVLARIAYTTYKGSEKFNRLQAVENKIFKMIDLHYINLNSIKVINITGGDVDPRWVYGSEAFESMYEDLKGFYNNIFFDVGKEDKSINEVEKIKESFESLYEKYGSQFGKYYKNLYLLIEYIDKQTNENVKGFDSQFFIRLIKVQLSKYEILMLAYNCIWIYDQTQKEGDKEFIKYAGKYKLLSALETEELIKPEHKKFLENYYK
jgi:hypothetical protein